MGLFGIKISLRNPFGKHSLLGGAARTASKLAPLAGMIPGVGLPLAAGIGAGTSLLAGKNVLKGAAAGAGGSLFGKLGKIGLGKAKLGGVGNLLKKTFTTERGGLDVGKLASVAGAGLSLAGQRSAATAANRQNQSATDLRNMLMSRLLAAPNYNFMGGP